MCPDGLSESSGFKPAKGTRCFLHQLIFSSRCDFPLRFRADVQPIKSSTCQQINSKTEFKVSREHVMVKGKMACELGGESSCDCVCGYIK